MASIGFEIGQEASNAEITSAFGGSSLRAMRVSKETKTIALLVNYASPRYTNHWEGNVLHFEAFHSGPHDEQSWEYYLNRQLHDAKENGFRVVLFERYPKTKTYVYRGEVEVRGREERLDPVNPDQSSGRRLTFLLHPIRHRMPRSEHAILDVQIWIEQDDDHWASYLLSRQQELNPHGRDGTSENVISSLWRAYASNVIDSFLADVEIRLPVGLVAEYDLEQGSIKSVFSIVVGLAGFAASTIAGIANYPKAKESWPVVKHDAQVALKAAAVALEKKFPGVVIMLSSKDPKNPLPDLPQVPTLGPPLVRRRDGIVTETRSIDVKKTPDARRLT